MFASVAILLVFRVDLVIQRDQVLVLVRVLRLELQRFDADQVDVLIELVRVLSMLRAVGNRYGQVVPPLQQAVRVGADYQRVLVVPHLRVSSAFCPSEFRTQNLLSLSVKNRIPAIVIAM